MTSSAAANQPGGHVPELADPAPSAPVTDDLLWHTSFSPTSPETIILLHGLGSSHFEWQHVWPTLSPAYHVLVPDMAGHCNSAHISPVTISAQADSVAALIRAHAHGGQAHVVGLSMGGFVALEVARTHPDAVRSVFATGCAPFAGWRMWIALRPRLVVAVNGASNLVPRWIAARFNDTAWKWQGLDVPEELKKDMGRNIDSRVFTQVFGSIAEIDAERARGVRTRTLAVAGGRMDAVKATGKQGAALRHGCERSRAVVVRAAVHPWNLQFPDLFARGILAWIEERPLPEEFEELKEEP